MRRTYVIAIVLSLGAVLAGPGLSGASAPRTNLQGFVCQTAREPAQRSVSVTAIMRPLAHTKRMAMRFDLLERQHRGGPVTNVVYGDLGKWLYPRDRTLGQRPGDRFKLTKQVLQLGAPDLYSFRVSFRWTGAHGKTLGSTVRSSPLCFQPELRPDLRVTSIRVKALKNPAKSLYVAVVRNTGASAVGVFDVQFADPVADGTLIKDKSVPGLAAHHEATVTFTGPVCQTATPPSITADPQSATDDYNRANNTLVAACPAP